MNLKEPFHLLAKDPKNTKGARSGSAVLIILVLIAAMALIVIANSTTIFCVKQEILRIEERHQRMAKEAGRAMTNPPSTSPAKPAGR